MRFVFKVCAVAVVVALIAGPASAQRPQRPGGGGFGRGGGGLESLLANESVRTELKIDKDQAAKIEEATKKFREDNKDDFDKASFQNQDTKPEEKAEIRRKLADKFQVIAKDLLKPEQLKRAKQIQLQQQAQFGIQVYTSEEVQKELKITDEQKEKIKTISDDLRKDMQDLGMGGNIQERLTKIREMTKEAGDKVQKLLTDDQKKAWKEMTGEPFTIQQPRRPGAERPPAGGTRQAEPKKIDF